MDRFLNNNDYISIVTEEALVQLIRQKETRLAQAEEAAEVSLLEYLSTHYEIEKALAQGKMIKPYNRQITYPAGTHFYFEDQICQTLKTINGYKAPSNTVYWKKYEEYIENPDDIELYRQFGTYSPGDIVKFGGVYYVCAAYNGFDFKNIRIPGVDGWQKVEDVVEWEANMDYELWKVVEWSGNFYALAELEGLDKTQNPEESDNWGQIADYDPEYNEYELSEHEYVVYNNDVYYPLMDVNSGVVQMNESIVVKDPRNPNVKKHLLRIAVYELHKLISPNNISQSRITDYETSIKWLQDASKMRINPQIPRKIDEQKKPITDWQLATFQAEMDATNNPWLV